MKINFARMKIGDSVALPPGKWSDARRVHYEAATAFMAKKPGRQFEIWGHDGSDFEKAQWNLRWVR